MLMRACETNSSVGQKDETLEQKLKEHEERTSGGGFDGKYKGEEERGMCRRGEREEKNVEKNPRCRKSIREGKEEDTRRKMENKQE